MAFDRAKTLANAEKQLKAGKLVEAIAEFKKLAEDNPRDMNVINKLGDLCARAGKNPDAIRYFLRIAEFYADDGFYLKAIAMYKKVSKLDPSNMECLQHLAALYQQQGLTIEAKAQFLGVVEHFLKAGQIKKALEIYPKILEIEPDNLKGRLGYADLLARSGSVAEAGREYRIVAQGLAKTGMLEEAIKVAQKGAKMLPGNADMMSLVLTLSKEAQKSPGDMLASVVEMAKANGDNPRSLALLGEAYLCAGKSADAEKVFRRLIGLGEKAPVEVAAAVGRYHIARQKPDEALEWIGRAAESFVGAGRGEDAIGLLAEFSRAFPEHRQGLAKRAEIAETAGDQKAQAESLAALADLLEREGETAQAMEVLRRLTEVDPRSARHGQRLEALEQGGATGRAPASRPAGGGGATAAPAIQDIQEGAIDLEEAAPVIVDSDEMGEPVEEAAEADDADADDAGGSGPGSRIQDLSEEEEETGEPEDDDFISEHLTEAEVFVKYGLLEKAKDQLQKILAKHPKHIPSHTRLKEIYYEEGDKDKAVAECLALATLLKARNRAEESQDCVNEAIRIDPNNPRVKEYAGGAAAPAAAAAPAPAAAAPRPAKPAPVRPAAPPAAPTPARPAAAVPPPARPAAAKPPGPAKLVVQDEVPELRIDDAGEEAAVTIAADDDETDLTIEIDMDEPPAPAPRPVPSASKPASAPPTAAKPAVAPPAPARPAAPEKVEEETPEDFFGGMALDGGKDAIGVAGGSDAPGMEAQLLGATAKDPDAEKLGEVDFYIDQGLQEEARAVLFQLQKQYPESAEVARRFERANRPGEAAAPAKAPTSSGPAALDLDVERAFAAPSSGGSSPAKAAPAAIPRASKAKPVFKMETATAETEGDFFDLAGELDKTLADVQVAVDGHDDGGPEETHSIDEIFRAFRKGVEQQVDAQDYETHYNLGIAYKEMGLIDEAIAEFQYAAKDKARTVECCGILGLCFREKGMAPLALKWFQKGLDMPGIGEQELIGLRYDMAEVYREQGDYGKAFELYTEVYGVDSTYREVAGRLKEVRKQINS